MKIYFCFIFCLFFSFEAFAKTIESIHFKSPDKKYPGKDDVVAELYLPKNTTYKLPVIITQHGSTRDTLKFKKSKGKSDEYSKRIIKRGLKEGYAVVAIDAFYKKNIKPTDKKKFPQGTDYAIALKKILAKDSRLDANNFFYTGFSWGASKTLGYFHPKRYKNDPYPFKAIVAAEPGCNAVIEPTKVNFATLILKGEESHYYYQACETYTNMIKQTGSKVEYILMPKVNHFFSTKGKIGKGVAFNGCSKDIAIFGIDRKVRWFSGAQTSRKEVIKKCMTKESGSGKNRKKLNEAINYAFIFFNKYKN